MVKCLAFHKTLDLSIGGNDNIHKENANRIDNMKPRNIRVAALVYDHLCTFEFSVAVEVFGLPRPELGDLYDFRVCALEERPLDATGGVSIVAKHGLAQLSQAETIVIPGWRGNDVRPPDKLLKALQCARDRGARILSICSGVFVLAYAGLLDGKRATTHWMYADQLAKQFPQINVDPAVLYVDEGQVVTSAGSAAGLDMCLHVVRQDYGSRIVNKIARRLVVAPHRDGGQAQFIETPISASDQRFAGLLEWMQLHIAEPMRIQTLAESVSMSSRTFERRFRQITGHPPGGWIKQQRISVACELLATGSASVESIASQVGFGSGENLRHHFRSEIGINPLEYRKRFRVDADE